MNEKPPRKKSRHRWWQHLLKHFPHRLKSKKDLLSVLGDANKEHLLGNEALRMIEGVLRVSELHVRDIMVPRSQMAVVQLDAPPQEFIPKIIESGHSRFPVIGENRDEVIGVLLAKDLLRYSFSQEEAFNMRDVLRPTVFIPESKRLNVLLREFRLKRNHLAVVADEYGGIAGLVTIEDVLEQIVGNIEDEYDIDEVNGYIKQIGKAQYNIKGLTPIEHFNEYFETQFSNEEFDTVGGYVTHELGHLPKRGESTHIGKFQFKILHTDSRRVKLLRVSVKTA